MSSGSTFWWKRCLVRVPTRKMKTHHVAEDKWHDTVHGMRKRCLPQFHYLNAAACCVKNTSCALVPQQTVFGLSVTEAVLSAAQADTLHSLASGFTQAEPCDRSSQCSVAGRHLHHMRIELHGRCLSARRRAPTTLYANMLPTGQTYTKIMNESMLIMLMYECMQYAFVIWRLCHMWSGATQLVGQQNSEEHQSD